MHQDVTVFSCDFLLRIITAFGQSNCRHYGPMNMTRFNVIPTYIITSSYIFKLEVQLMVIRVASAVT